MNANMSEHSCMHPIAIKGGQPKALKIRSKTSATGPVVKILQRNSGEDVKIKH